MEFYDDPRRAQIEPMHEFMQTWARWGKIRPSRYTSSTYQVMCWVRDHSKRVSDIREGIVLGQPIHCSDEDNEKVGLKVEHYLRLLRERGYRDSVRRLKTYYMADLQMPLGRLANKIGVPMRKVEATIKDDLYRLSEIWMD